MSKALSQIKKNKKMLVERMSSAGMNKTRIEREISFALQLIGQDKQLQDCTPVSLQAAVINIANVGLTLNPAANEAALIARWNSKTRQKEATLMPQYRGLAKLACQDGNVVDITANVVYENDDFSIDMADTVKPVTHRIDYTKKDRGEKMGVYAVATYANGMKKAEYLFMEDILKIRDCSDGFNAFMDKKIKVTPWVQWFDEMARKSAVKRIVKYLTGGTENEQLNEAIELDNQDYPASAKQIGYIESLISNANVTPEQERKILSEMHDYNKEDAQSCINFLIENQLDAVRDNGGRGQLTKDVKKSLTAAVEDENR